jgi:hypothetical protein
MVEEVPPIGIGQSGSGSLEHFNGIGIGFEGRTGIMPAGR